MRSVIRKQSFNFICLTVSIILFAGCGSKENKIPAGGNPTATAPPPPKVDAYIVKTSDGTKKTDQ